MLIIVKERFAQRSIKNMYAKKLFILSKPLYNHMGTSIMA